MFESAYTFQSRTLIPFLRTEKRHFVYTIFAYWHLTLKFLLLRKRLNAHFLLQVCMQTAHTTVNYTLKEMRKSLHLKSCFFHSHRQQHQNRQSTEPEKKRRIIFLEFTQ